MKKNNQRNIAIFASGNGTNAGNIIQYFKQTQTVNICLIVCNNPEAGVIKVADKNNVPYLLITKERFKADGYLQNLKDAQVDFIVLAGFLWKVPAILINEYKNKIINIHPALLPKYGGRGMYGNFVHEAVLAAKEFESGITIHFVDEFYDNGQTIFQATCPVLKNDTADTLAKRIHALEYEYFPRVIEDVIKKQ